MIMEIKKNPGGLGIGSSGVGGSEATGSLGPRGSSDQGVGEMIAKAMFSK